MQANIILLVVSSFIAVGLALGIASLMIEQLPEGAEFSNLDEFRSAALERDDRDTLEDGSVSFRSIVEIVESDEIIYRLKPNLNVRFQGVSVRTNSYGFRGPRWSEDKGENEIRIALLGDSFAFGWGVVEEEIFASVLERNLNQHFAESGKQIQVLNFGIPGYSTFQEYALFRDYGLKFSADIVVVFFIENDFGMPFFIRDIGQDRVLANATSYVRKLWSAEDEEIKAQKRRLEHLTDANRAFRNLADLTQENSIPLYLAINPNPNWEDLLRKLWITTKRDDIHVLSLRPRYLELIEERQLVAKDLNLPTDPHPSPAKHRILGEVLAEQLQNSVSQIANKN